MLKNYLKIAIRNLIKHKTNSIINILGLAIGIAACLMIALYVKDELTFDAYHKDADRIYRVVLRLDEPERGEATFARSSKALAHALRKECPSVELAARFTDIWGAVVKNSKGDLFFEQGTIYSADPDLFDLFTIPFIYGNHRAVFDQTNNILVSEAIAFKYFGHTNVMGEFLFFNENLRDESGPKQWKIAGVFKDIPHNSHLPHFKLLIPMKPIEQYSEDAWRLSREATYIKVAQNTDINVLEQEINRIANQYNSDFLMKSHATQHYFLQSLRDIHLHSNFMWEYATLGSLNEIIAFSVIALLILCIACLNFINLSTAQASIRAKEIGVRKVVGAHRITIVRQFIVESVLTAFIAFPLAFLIVELLLPGFNACLGKELKVGYFSDPTFMITSALIVVFVGFVASVFPAFFLASFKPTVILKGLLPASRGASVAVKNKVLRNGLVVFQFVVSLVLIISSLLVYRQVSYMKNKDLGFHKEQMLIVPTQGVKMSQTVYSEFESIKSEFMQHHSVVGVTIQVAAPGRDKLTEKIKLLDKDNAEEMFSCIEFGDADYLNTYDIPLIAGRNYQKGRTTDKGEAFIINETAAKALGFSSPENAIHQRLSVWFWKGEIIGVMKDFHFRSLHHKIEPLVCFAPKFNPEYFTIRLNTQNMPETLAFLKEKWAAFFPNNPLEYYFIDEDFASFYQAEEKFGTLIFVFTGLAIFIASLGLFGLATFTTERRTKEIGIRKVVGASVTGIVVMLSKEFTKLVLFANIIAWPIAFYAMSKWLQNFAYRIDLTIWPFLLAGLAALLITLLTVSWRAIRAAMTNPVEALRYE